MSTWVDGSDWTWNKHPVIHLSMGMFAGADATKETIVNKMREILLRNAHEFGVALEDTGNVAGMLESLMQAANKKFQAGALVIIDEYDKPLLDKALGDQMKSDEKTYKSMQLFS